MLKIRGLRSVNSRRIFYIFSNTLVILYRDYLLGYLAKCSLRYINIKEHVYYLKRCIAEIRSRKRNSVAGPRRSALLQRCEVDTLSGSSPWSTTIVFSQGLWQKLGFSQGPYAFHIYFHENVRLFTRDFMKTQGFHKGSLRGFYRVFALGGFA